MRNGQTLMFAVVEADGTPFPSPLLPPMVGVSQVL
jgi:hypothetical protein